jgi:hypothetical protein
MRTRTSGGVGGAGVTPAPTQFLAQFRQQLRRDRRGQVEHLARLVVDDAHVKRPEYLGEFGVGCFLDRLSEVRHRVEHGEDFVGAVACGPLLVESFDRVRDRCLPRAQLHDALLGQGDERMRRVVVLLKAKGLRPERPIELV